MKMILDVDTGIDDALAIAYVLGTPQIELLGIICSYGNVQAKQAVLNTRKILSLFHREDIPVIWGAGHPLSKESFEVRPLSMKVHGVDGLGNTFLSVDDEKIKTDMDAVKFLYDTATKYGEELTIVTEGPLTNLAAAVIRYPDIVNSGVKIIIMGGAVCVEGNMTHCAETNIYQDIKAANIVFASGLHCTLVGLDITLRTLLTRKETGEWRKTKTAWGKFLADMTEYYIGFHEEVHPEMDGCALHDPLAAAIAYRPELVTIFPCCLKVLEEGPNEGRCVLDLVAMNQRTKNIGLCVDVSVDKFILEFNSAINRLLKNFA